ncbi:hypothetical protein IKX12_03965 [Candidatus Saccharibacteria bacterium]|nr:hypothetical protein [Candidatus Saccharibacteria bacterium]
MSESYLKDLLWRGRQVEFDHGMKRYVVKLVDYAFKSEYAFGEKYGRKTTSDYFEGILYLRDYGYSLSELLRCVDSSRIYIY